MLDHTNHEWKYIVGSQYRGSSRIAFLKKAIEEIQDTNGHGFKILAIEKN